jgi:type IV fimbrial biogenesis protein FimT
MEVQMFKQKAFTLIELMVTLAVLGVIAAIAVPSFDQFQRGARASSDVSAITTALALARSEAVKRNRPVCVVSADWAAGWDVRIDDNGNNTCAAGETLVRTFAGISASASLSVQRNGADASQVLYRPNGRADEDYTLQYRSEGADTCVPHRDRNLTIEPAGRTAIAKCAAASSGGDQDGD